MRLKKAFGFVIMLLLINYAYALDFEFNLSNLPLNYSHYVTFYKSYNTSLNFSVNESWLYIFEPQKDIIVNETNNFTTLNVTIILNNTFPIGWSYGKLNYYDNVTNETLFIPYNINMINNTNNTINTPQTTTFLQIDLYNYMFYLKTWETLTFNKLINVTVFGNGIAYTTCSSWLTCNPYNYNLTNNTISYLINITTPEVGAGSYTENATFWLQEPNNLSRLYETNLTFSFVIIYELKPLPSFNETCNIYNMTALQYDECRYRYFLSLEERIRLLNQTQNVTQIVYTNNTFLKEVIPWSEGNTSAVINKLLELQEIERTLKVERAENKRLATQIDGLAKLNNEVTAKYEDAVNNIPVMVEGTVKSLSGMYESKRDENEVLRKTVKFWNYVKYSIYILILIIVSIFSLIYLRMVFPFWG